MSKTAENMKEYKYQELNPMAASEPLVVYGDVATPKQRKVMESAACMFTVEELRSELLQSKADYAQGHIYTIDELRSRHRV